MDLAPTLLELAGATYPASYNGRPVEQPRGKSMAPLLSRNSPTVHRPDEAIGWEYNNSKAIRISDHKAIGTGGPFGPGEWQVFDLSVDPGESNDLSTQNPKLKQSLIDAGDEYAKSVGVIPPQGDPLPITNRQSHQIVRLEIRICLSLDLEANGRVS
jgi:arylsulfatase A-like enzyme